MKTQDDRTEVYLKPITKLEPLVCGWYAWTHLVSPVQFAMNLAYRYIPLLQSFLKNTSIHLAASRDPTLFGGPFVHLPETSRLQVDQLIAETTRRAGAAIRMVELLRQVDERLQASARGFSLNEHYQALPTELAGW